MTTPYDDLPVEVRRANWGWFGDPWPSSICYDDDGRLREDMRKPFPAGESCLYCGEEFSEGDSGKAMPSAAADGWTIVHVHKECLFREVAGGLAHHEGRCRQEALEIWRRLNAGTLYGR